MIMRGFGYMLLLYCVCIDDRGYDCEHQGSTACTERLQQIPDHSACLPRSSYLISSGVSDADQQTIVSEHNRLRGGVDPPATNMLKLYWDVELALVAQAWASNCKLEHDSYAKRNILGVYEVGQNIAWDFQRWTEVIQAWYDEVKDFTYGQQNDLKAIGHYTQVVWADTTRVGCGYAVCYNNNTRFYVCNYGPSGNRGGWSKPYKNGSAGLECGGGSGNLCDCKGEACENGGSINRDTCECTCMVENIYVGDVCKLDCEDKTLKEPSYCNDPTQPYMPKNCGVYADAPDRCPLMCNKCPYGDFRYDYNATASQPSTRSTTPTTHRPHRECSDRYRVHRHHTACLQPSPQLDADSKANLSSSDIDLIVTEHNRYRGNVNPQAANMLALRWDDEIALLAQIWAETCSMKSDEVSNRRIPGRYDLGQNIAVGVSNLTEAISQWNASGENLVYGDSSEGADDYTQLVWASTTRLGCGQAKCDGVNFFVCNYGPRGNNLLDNSRPYENGTSCSTCPSTCEGNLCVCGTSCENEGMLDPETCQCSCKSEFYQEPNCKLTCEAIEPSFCNTMPQDACRDSVIVPVFCPFMCNVCPFADRDYNETGTVTPPPTQSTQRHNNQSVGGTRHLKSVLEFVVTAAITALAIVHV